VAQFVSAGTNFYSGRTETPFSTLDSNFNAATAVAVDKVMILTPDVIAFQGFDDLQRALLIWIPRIVSAAKLSVQDGNEAAVRYGVGTLDGTSFMYMPSVGEGYRRFGWAGVVIVYTLLGIVYGLSAGIAWRFRHRREWAAMLMFITIAAGGVWSSTILSLAYEALWVIPKYFVFFFVIRVMQDIAWRMRPRFRRRIAAPQAAPA
jgi:hypothetical protein